MALARQCASLGLSARGNAGIKVRQPLSKAYVHVSQGRAELTQAFIDIITDELNIKSLSFVSDASQLVTYRILPDNKLLGPKFGARFPQIRKALSDLDPLEVARKVNNNESVQLQVDGEEITLAAEEIIVQAQPAEGLAVAADKIITIGIDIQITPELKAEGLARELVRRIQQMRKDADFNIEDRIEIYYKTQGELRDVFAQWESYIKNETLAIALIEDVPPADAYTEKQKVDGLEVTISIKQKKE
jgi:isoleucyl-tRNA synthetase